MGFVRVYKKGIKEYNLYTTKKNFFLINKHKACLPNKEKFFFIYNKKDLKK